MLLETLCNRSSRHLGSGGFQFVLAIDPVAAEGGLTRIFFQELMDGDFFDWGAGNAQHIGNDAVKLPGFYGFCSGGAEDFIVRLGIVSEAEDQVRQISGKDWLL